MRGLDQVAEAIEVVALSCVQSKPRQGQSDILIVSVALIPNWYALRHGPKVVKEALVVGLLPVRCHGVRRPWQRKAGATKMKNFEVENENFEIMDMSMYHIVV